MKQYWDQQKKRYLCIVAYSNGFSLCYFSNTWKQNYENLSVCWIQFFFWSLFKCCVVSATTLYIMNFYSYTTQFYNMEKNILTYTNILAHFHSTHITMLQLWFFLLLVICVVSVCISVLHTWVLTDLFLSEKSWKLLAYCLIWSNHHRTLDL